MMGCSKVAALLIAILGGVTIRSMSTDIFPEIDIPVVSIIWSYNGVAAEEMEKRIVTPSERGLNRNR
jgi:multidrug efflux pump subunit AcrB